MTSDRSWVRGEHSECALRGNKVAGAFLLLFLLTSFSSLAVAQDPGTLDHEAVFADIGAVGVDDQTLLETRGTGETSSTEAAGQHLAVILWDERGKGSNGTARRTAADVQRPNVSVNVVIR